MTFDGAPSLSKLAIAVAVEHLVYMQLEGFSNTEIAESIGGRPFLSPSDDDLIETFARKWMRIRPEAAVAA